MNEWEKRQKIQALDERRQQLAAQNQRRRKHLRRRLIAATVFFVLITSMVGKTYWSKLQLEEEELRLLEEAKVELEATRREKKELEQRVEQLRDEEYIANLARNELLFSKDGEIIFYFSPEE